MITIDELRSNISTLLNDGDLASFRAWFSPSALDIDASDDEAAIRMVYAVERELADLDEAFLDQYNLMQNLRAKLYPSATGGYFVMAAGAYRNDIVTGASFTLESAGTVFGPAGVKYASAL